VRIGKTPGRDDCPASKVELDVTGFEQRKRRRRVERSNGEIWVKGYVSLNPRSGRAPSSGTPVYTGFLSVEIKDSRRVTLWSYLVKAGSESQDISKDLSKRIAKHLAAALDGEHPAPINVNKLGRIIS
jgi:hypothetical protein